MQQESGGIKDREVEGSLRRLSKWHEGGNETEPLCAGSGRDGPEGSLFGTKNIRQQRNPLTSFQLVDVMKKALENNFMKSSFSIAMLDDRQLFFLNSKIFKICL